jgi:hypothetical protein
MTRSRSLRAAALATAGALMIGAAPATAGFKDPVVVQSVPFADVVATDLASRGISLALTADIRSGDVRDATLAWSTDSGDSWSTLGLWPASQVVETEVTICAGFAVAVYARLGSTQRDIISDARSLDSDDYTVRSWTDPGVHARRPDVSCVANDELAIAWFQETDEGHVVRLKTGQAYGSHVSPQSFGLGRGTPSRDLSVAVTSDRVYVAWFRGDELKLRRFRIGTGSGHPLTSLGTKTLATLKGGSTPEIGASGSRVVVAYRQHGDLKVRRSTDRGASFGSARTLRNVGTGVTVTPTTVAVRGQLVAVGAMEEGGSAARGRGYRSTNGGTSFSQVSSHSSGRIVATTLGSSAPYRYAEAWDESITTPAPQRLRYRMDVPPNLP